MLKFVFHIKKLVIMINVLENEKELLLTFNISKYF